MWPMLWSYSGLLFHLESIFTILDIGGKAVNKTDKKKVTCWFYSSTMMAHQLPSKLSELGFDFYLVSFVFLV